MDLQGAADQLYAISPDDFVAQRTALVAEARAAKDRPLAKEIGQLRRPTRSAWLVNVLARAEPERLTELLELGTALQQAQQRMAGDELRRLSKERRTLIDSLSRRAGELGTSRSTPPPMRRSRRSARPCRPPSATRPSPIWSGPAGCIRRSATAGSVRPIWPRPWPPRSRPPSPRPRQRKRRRPPTRTVPRRAARRTRPRIEAAEQEAAAKRQAAEEAAEAPAEAESAAEAATDPSRRTGR